MSSSRPTRIELLHSLLTPLVNGWGMASVRECLEEIDKERFLFAYNDQKSTENTSRKIEKPSAVELTMRSALPENHKRFIGLLAEKFDAKTFLPSAGDIRYFFEANHEPGYVVKHRSDAFRKILKILSEMPTESLGRLVANSAYSGPSQLGPLSDTLRRIRGGLERLDEPEAGIESHQVQKSAEDIGLTSRNEKEKGKDSNSKDVG